MAGLKWLQQFFQDIAQGVRRIFGARDDDYPETGVQPFESEPYQENQDNS